MNVLYVYCHPLSDSFHAGIRDKALTGLARTRHSVDLLDLYADNFNPVLSAGGRRAYHDTAVNQAGLEPYIARLRRADALVLQFPVWSFGAPAMLKGFVDRLFMPGVGFDISDPAHVKRLLGFRRLVGITTYGRDWWTAAYMGNPPKRWVTRYVRHMSRHPVKADYLALYHMNVASDAERGAFLAKVENRMAGL